MSAADINVNMSAPESNSDEVLMDEYDSAIDGIRDSRGTGSCHAHEPMARGMILLLRDAKARARRSHEARRAIGATIRVGAIISLIAGALVALGLVIRTVEVRVTPTASAATAKP